MFERSWKVAEEAPPSTPWKLSAWKDCRCGADQFLSSFVTDREKARDISEYRGQKGARISNVAKSFRVSLEGLAEQLKTAGMKELNASEADDIAGSVKCWRFAAELSKTRKCGLKLLSVRAWRDH